MPGSIPPDQPPAIPPSSSSGNDPYAQLQADLDAINKDINTFAFAVNSFLQNDTPSIRTQIAAVAVKLNGPDSDNLKEHALQAQLDPTSQGHLVNLLQGINQNGLETALRTAWSNRSVDAINGANNPNSLSNLVQRAKDALG